MKTWKICFIDIQGEVDIVYIEEGYFQGALLTFYDMYGRNVRIKSIEEV